MKKFVLTTLMALPALPAGHPPGNHSKPSTSTPLQESSVDGIHPDDYGYYGRSHAIGKPLLRILRRYGIRSFTPSV
ncbi:MAG: hypothetical protein J6P62_00385 [Bacteroidales bacterium]|nr:hypothetical protein [Bacteroidales bacterium]